MAYYAGPRVDRARSLSKRLDDEEKFSRRISYSLGSASAVFAVVLIALGVAHANTVNTPALALGYTAVCCWLGVIAASGYAAFNRRRLKPRLEELRMAFGLEQSRADQDKREHGFAEPVQRRSLRDLERATAEGVTAFWRPVKLVWWGAGAAAAFTLAAIGFVVVPSAGAGTGLGDGDSSSDPLPILRISWAVEEPLFVQTPASFERPPQRALVALRVVDPRRPDCAGRYDWQVTSANEVPLPVQVRSRNRCLFEADLVAGQRYRVRVTRSGARGEANVRVGDLLVASFGDSVASGEGNPARSNPRWADHSTCNRSLIAGPRQAAELISAASEHSRVVFFHLACTGAWIDGIGAPRAFGVHPSVLPDFGTVGPSQTEKFRAHFGNRRDGLIVLLSVGANDVGFGPILRFCLRPVRARCFEKKLRRTNVPVQELVERRLVELRRAYGRLAETPPFDEGRVFVTEYFDPLHNERDDLCPVLGMSTEEAEWAAERILRPLNGIVRERGAANKWVVVGGVADAFRPYGYCARPETWIVRIPQAFKNRNARGSFHPNALGQEAYGDLIFQAVKPYLSS